MLYFRVFIVTYSKFIHFVGCRIHHLSFVACRVCGLRAYHDPGTCTCACACTCTAVPSYCLVAATSLRSAECCVCDEKERSLPPTKQLRRSFSPQSEPSPASAASQHCLQPIRCPASPSPPTPPPPLAAAAHVAAVTLAANAAAALAATALAAAEDLRQHLPQPLRGGTQALHHQPALPRWACRCRWRTVRAGHRL